MSWMLWDPDEWESVSTYESYGEMFGVPMGSCSFGYKPRPPKEVATIKAKRRREHEDEVLAEAEQIKARRSADPV